MPTTVTLTALCWKIFVVVWLISALFTKRTAERQTVAERVRYSVPFFLAFLLMFCGLHDPRLKLPEPLHFLYTPVLPHSRTVLSLGLAITAPGLAILLWSRAIIGTNWSGTVTYKENHQLIRHGPYAYVRHPIYSGLLLMFLGTAITVGNLGGLLGFPFLFVSCWIKLKQEEALMVRHFEDAYRAYKARVKALVPYVF